VVVIKPGGSNSWDAEVDKIRICSLTSGKLKVKLGDADFLIGGNGMFTIKAGSSCTVWNRLYLDATIHVTTLTEH
jgi:hypothetical protein